MDRAEIMEQVRDVAVAAAIIVAVVLACLAGATLVSLAWTVVYSGTLIEYEGTVQSVTRSNFLAPHTEVVLRTYSEDDVHFNLGGYHDFKIGAQYRVSMVMKPYVFGIDCWGKLNGEGIQELEG